MKESRSVSFKNATLTVNGDVITVEEISKDSSSVYNLTNKLREFDGVEGLNITIKKDTELPSEE
jgi:hypothetical protein